MQRTEVSRRIIFNDQYRYYIYIPKKVKPPEMRHGVREMGGGDHFYEKQIITILKDKTIPLSCCVDSQVITSCTNLQVEQEHARVCQRCRPWSGMPAILFSLREMRKHVPKIPAALITLLIVVFGGIAIAMVLSYSIIGLSRKLPVYQTILADTYGHVVEFLEDSKHPSQDIRAERSLFSLLQEASNGVKVYVSVTSSTGALQAVINIVLYMALGIDSAVTWGILFFFMNFIPVIGGFAAVIPPVALGFLESGWEVALAVLVLFSINNLVWDNILKPGFMEKSLNIPFWVTILSVIFWSWVLGSVGTIVALPLTMVVRNLYYSKNISGN